MLDSNGSVVLLIPVAGAGCGGHCVALFRDAGVAPTFGCSMPAAAPVTSTPAVETTSGGSSNFPDYAFFGTSGPAGKLYVYDANARGSCQQQGSADLGGAMAGSPLVFPGQVDSRGKETSIDDEIFVVVTDSNTTNLQHWRYTEDTQVCHGSGGSGGCGGGTITTTSLNRLPGTTPLTAAVGANATGYAISSTVPARGATLNLVVSSGSGKLALARLVVGSGPSYTVPPVAGMISLTGGITHSPYWCHCPGGQDLIGVGTTNGFLYVLNNALAVQWTYDGRPDGWPAINTTPMADLNGDWYFGASDGSVYDVEIPVSGPQMFKAAKFGPGGAIGSSPVVGMCSTGPCLYFGSTAAGSYFARLGTTRVIDLQACVTSASGSTTCVANPRLWARVEIGSPAIVGSRGIYVQGWSYYSP